MNKSQLVLIGGGGHCHSAIEVIESVGLFNIHAILDKPEKRGKSIMNYLITGGEELIENLFMRQCQFAVTIGFVRYANPRIRAYEHVKLVGGALPVIISPYATISRSSEIGEGGMVFHKAVINSNVKAGVNNIFNTGSITEHDCLIGDHNHISTGSILNGNCVVGNRVFVGSGSIIKEGISIADDVIIGAGSVITKNIIEAGVYYGSPGRRHG